MIRILVLWKIVKREIFKSIHHNAVMPIRINGKIVEERVILGIVAFVCVYILILGVSTAITGCLTCLSNVGPGFSGVGPTNSFADFAAGYKLLFSALMLMGRLEFFTILALLTPQRGNRLLN